MFAKLSILHVVLVGSLTIGAFGIDMTKVRPIYESAYWRETHPALAKWIARSEAAYMAVGGNFNISPRITGGDFAVENQFPYQAALVITLEDGEQSFCGGSLITNNFVLTASHCLDKATRVTVLLGAHNVALTNENTRSVQLIMGRNLIMHENYNASQYQNDIALIQLNTPVAESDVIKIINLPRLSQIETTFAGSQCVVSGWGRYLDSVNLLSDTLRFVNLNILDNSGCTPFFGTAVTPMKLCTSGQNRVGPCGGDSGGPVVIDEGGSKVQVALVSFSVGFGCQLGWPTVHTRVSRYLDWISRNSDLVIRV